MSIKPSKYLQEAKKLFEAAANEEVAVQQSKYMRHQFAFYGMKAPVWVALSKELFSHYGLLQGEALEDFVQLCYEEDYRECHYLGLQMAEKAMKQQEEGFIHCLEACIVQNSWWDTVDWVAKLVGIHLMRFPHLTSSITGRWIASENFWLQRVAIIFQLTYKTKTDEKLLYSYILYVADSKEFFLQKAAGWALRQYSKTNPESVKSFISKHQLAPLTAREGARLMKKNGMW